MARPTASIPLCAVAAALGVVTLQPLSAFAQSAPAPITLSTDTAYGYAADGKLVPYRLGTNNAKFLFKGAKKVPRETLFFIGENGQLYMRSGPFLESDGKFRFGPG